MDSQIITTLISTSGAVLVGIAGMWISAGQLGKRIDDLRQDTNTRFAAFESNLNTRFSGFDKRLEVIEGDLKQFYRMLADHDGRLSKLEGE